MLVSDDPDTSRDEQLSANPVAMDDPNKQTSLLPKLLDATLQPSRSGDPFLLLGTNRKQRMRPSNKG